MRFLLQASYIFLLYQVLLCIGRPSLPYSHYPFCSQVIHELVFEAAYKVYGTLHPLLLDLNMAFSVDHDFLRNSHPRDAGPYLHKIASQKQVAASAISQEILQAVAIESLPPRVYTLWLSACPDESAVALGLQQTDSVLVRSAAITDFRRWFRTNKYWEIWHAVGGSEGIAALLATFSVDHVKMFCKKMAMCSTSLSCREGRQELTTELCQLLTARFFPDSTDARNPDHRPFLNIYTTLVYACTPAFQDSWMDNKDLPKLDLDKVFETNTYWFQQKCFSKAVAGDEGLWSYSALLTSVPTIPSEQDSTVLEPLSFAARVIETLIEHNVRFSDTKKKLEETFKTVLHRTAHRKTSASFTRRIIGLMSRYATQVYASEKYPTRRQSDPMVSGSTQSVESSNTSLELSYPQHLHDIARLWVRDPDALEPLLSNMLDVSKIKNISEIVDSLDAVRAQHRYRLLKWLLISKLGIDLEDNDQLHRIEAPVPFTLFRLLPKDVARDLLARFVSIGHPGISRSSHDKPNTGLDLLTVSLDDYGDIRRTKAASKISVYRRKAELTRDASSRKEWVNDSVMMAVTSGSLDLLAEVLTWSRRFIRDPVVSEIYWDSNFGQSTTLRRDDTIELLSGLPRKPNKDTSLSLLATDVQKGNDIGLLLLETATMAQREPSFYVNHWTQVQRLFADIAQCRVKRVERLRSSLGLPDDQLFALVWENTLQALLKAERLGLDERNQALQFNEIGGPLAVWGGFEEIQARNPSPATLRFVDELAAQRDAIWRDHRPKLQASVTTLQAPWPRGLPIQALLAIDIEGKVAQGTLPYLEERARSVVFVPHEHVLREIPEDKETQAAIGCFVDEYGEALRIYISWCDEEEKQRRTEAAWTHATTALSRDRLSPLECRLYWGKIFEEAGASHPVMYSIEWPRRPMPKLPQTNNHNQPEEWNPESSDSPVETKERLLQPTCLDCMTRSIRSRNLSACFPVPRPRIQRVYISQFWDFERFGSLIPPDAEEALIAARLLVMDSKSKANSKILSIAFPQGSNDIRFPSLFLDSEFLERKYALDELPLKVLGNTPPALLEQIASSLTAKLFAATDPSPDTIEWTFAVLKLLAWSDKPGLAIKHIIRIIINLPEHSSWHRVMLHQGVLKRLTAEQSRALVNQLADAISENTKERMKLQETAQDPTQAKNTKNRFVKVTTVKMLAQLMSGGEYVDEMFSVGVLGQLFKQSTHIDIRAAIVGSLTSILSWTKDANVEEAAIKVLENYAVPIAAEVSERSPMTEQRWAACEDKCELPDQDSEAPIRNSLFYYLDEVSRGDADQLKARKLIQRLYLPLVRISMENKSRWMKIFLCANNASDLMHYLPKAFGSDFLLKRFLQSYPAHMPADLFRHLHELLLFLMNPPEAVQNFTERLMRANPSPSYRDCWEVSTFFHPIFTSCIEPCRNGSFATPEDAASNGLIVPAQLQTLACEMMDTLLARYDKLSAHWTGFLAAYKPPVRQGTNVRQNWQRYCRPVVQYTIKKIESMRTPEWQRDPRRRPSRLPDIFPLRLWLLTYPSMPWEDDLKNDNPRQTFANELQALLIELVESRRSYHARFEQVVKAAKQCYEQDWAFLAWQLGKLEEEQTQRELTTVELLRIELADTLLQQARGPVKEKELLGMQAMLGRWRACLDEEVRDRGIATTSMLVEMAKRGGPNVLPLKEEGTR